PRTATASARPAAARRTPGRTRPPPARRATRGGLRGSARGTYRLSSTPTPRGRGLPDRASDGSACRQLRHDCTREAQLELRHPGAGAVFVLLRCSSSDAARAFQHAIADDRHGALAGNHVPAFGRDDALDDRAPRALGQLTTRPREASRSDGFALAAVDAAPDRTDHAIERDQPPAGDTARDPDPVL